MSRESTFFQPGEGPMPDKNLHGFPLYVENEDTNTRFVLLLDQRDREEFDNLPPGPSDAYVRVEDLMTNSIHRVGRASCGLGCYCAARFLPDR